LKRLQSEPFSQADQQKAYPGSSRRVKDLLLSQGVPAKISLQSQK
jgi:hypothetical protein